MPCADDDAGRPNIPHCESATPSKPVPFPKNNLSVGQQQVSKIEPWFIVNMDYAIFAGA